MESHIGTHECHSACFLSYEMMTMSNLKANKTKIIYATSVAASIKSYSVIECSIFDNSVNKFTSVFLGMYWSNVCLVVQFR